jgi:hypothetical protein
MEIKQSLYRTKYSEIFMDDHGILWLVPDPDVELDLEEVVACFDVYRKMGINERNKVLQIIDVSTDASMTKEGREYAALHGLNFFKASAVVSKSLTVRILVNFFNFFYKQPVPFKLFENVNAARNWLENFK